MAMITDTTERFSIAFFGDEIESINRRINGLRLMLVGLQSEQECPDFEDVFQALLDIQVSAKKIDAGYYALRREMDGPDA